jgi:predicted acylesterase/phospholipase RssA
MVRGLAAGLAATSVGACAGPSRLASLPEKLRVRKLFTGLPDDMRLVLDGSDDDVLAKIANEALRRELAHATKTGHPLGDANYLAISGGGENGAYGAGLLTEWTKLGTRPEFKGVTGVSTGALIAPFAYMGPEYDADLERFYTTISQKDVMQSRGLLTALLSDSAYDSTPLLNLIRGALSPKLMQGIAREYTEKGRLLFVATTNLDVPVGVLWNIGSIAASGHPQAADLCARVLLASASIPGVFPPVMIDIEDDGKQFQEMHVDGGTMAQVVLYPPSLSGADISLMAANLTPQEKRLLFARKRRIYVIRNSRPGADVQTVERSTFKIVGRAVSTLISTQGIGDLYQLYVIARRDNIDYNVAYIPKTFTDNVKEPFEQAYMVKLYGVGQGDMKDGKAWKKYPPGYDPTPLTGGLKPAGT